MQAGFETIATEDASRLSCQEGMAAPFKQMDGQHMCSRTGTLLTGKQVVRPLRFFVSATRLHVYTSRSVQSVFCTLSDAVFKTFSSFRVLALHAHLTSNVSNCFLQPVCLFS